LYYGAAGPLSAPFSNLVYSNKWTHLAFTTNDGIARTFINGVQAASSSASFTTDRTETGLGIGFRFGIGGSIAMSFDDLRVFSRGFTAQEIQALYRGGRGYGFRPNRTRYELGTVSTAGGFQSSRFKRRPMFLGSGILQ
jgi:hypothetical protein